MPPTTRVAVTLLGLAVLAGAQDPYKVAADHYHLAFDNQWARATHVTYQPHDTAPTHGHPPTPTTVYVYVTDGGAIRFDTSRANTSPESRSRASRCRPARSGSRTAPQRRIRWSTS